MPGRLREENVIPLEAQPDTFLFLSSLGQVGKVGGYRTIHVKLSSQVFHLWKYAPRGPGYGR